MKQQLNIFFSKPLVTEFGQKIRQKHNDTRVLTMSTAHMLSKKRVLVMKVQLIGWIGLVSLEVHFSLPSHDITGAIK